MKTEVVTITPAYAQSLLDKYLVPENQRNLMPSLVTSYANIMRAGLWNLTHQGIAISENGELIDGQHRLMAVIESGVTIQCNLSKGVAGENVIDAIDRGQERKVGQQLQLRHGYSNANLYSGVARVILEIAVTSFGKRMGKFSVGQCLRVLEVYGNEIKHCIDNRSKDSKIRNVPVIAAGAFALHAFPALSDFYSRLATGEGLVSGDPALAARRYILNVASAGSNGRDNTRVVLTCAKKDLMKEKYKIAQSSCVGTDFFIENQRRSNLKILKTCGYAE